MCDFSYSVFQVLRRKFCFFALQLLMLAQSLAPFACLFSNSKSSSCKFSISGLISGLKFSVLYKFSFLSYFSLKIVVFSWVVEFLENISAFCLKQDLVYSHQSLAGERLLDSRPRLEELYKIGGLVCLSVLLFVLPSFHKFSLDWLISFFWNLTWF